MELSGKKINDDAFTWKKKSTLKNSKVINFLGVSVKTFLKIFFSRARNVFDSVLGIFFFFFHM